MIELNIFPDVVIYIFYSFKSSYCGVGVRGYDVIRNWMFSSSFCSI